MLPFFFCFCYIDKKCMIIDVNVLMKAIVSNQYTVPDFNVCVSNETRRTNISHTTITHQSLATKIIQSIENTAAVIALTVCIVFVVSSSLNAGAIPVKIIPATPKNAQN